MAGLLVHRFSARLEPLIRSGFRSKVINYHQQRSATSVRNRYIKVSEEVRDALKTQKPVVALETTIYTHGFPYPENTALASHLESVVRVNGGVPASIGILNGIARVGFSAEELIELTSAAGKPETRKISRRDLAPILGLGRMDRKLNGGTTVAGTMILASLVGIKVFATGGLGGVHRGGEDSMDISADLTELGRTRIAVIASGCKSFLDVPRTLEYLETQGVTVGTFADGRDGNVDFPAFWTRESGIPAPFTIEGEKEAALMIIAQHKIPLDSGLLFANPVPAEHSIPKSEMDAIMAQAIHDAQASGSTGSNNTPFILKRIRELTNGASVTANRALIEANVARGTKVAVELQRLKLHFQRLDLQQLDKAQEDQYIHARAPAHDKTSILKPGLESSQTSDKALILPHLDTSMSPSDKTADIVVAGSFAIDLSCDFVQPDGPATSVQPQAQTSNPASIKQSLGGVGQNLATAIHYVGTSVRLCSAVANDVAGSCALQMLGQRGLDTAGVLKVEGSHTAQYVAINDVNKNLILAMADMDILEDTTHDFDTSWRPHLESCKPRWLVVDSNWDATALHKWLGAAKALGAKVAYEPVSAAKSKRLFAKSHGILAVIPDHTVDLATPNALELASMHDAAHDAGLFEREDWWRVINAIDLSGSGSRDKFVYMTNNALVDEGVPQQSIRLLPSIPCILTTMGEHGVLMTQLLRPGDDRLTSPDSAPYILSRSTDGNEVVGGVYMRLFPPVEQVKQNDIVSVNGVGDTFLGVLIAGLAREKPRDIANLIDVAQRGSVLTLRSSEAVSPQLSILKNLL